MTSPRGAWLPVAALLVAAVAWGSTVVVTKSAFATMSPLGVVAIRLFLTGVTLALMFPHRLRMPLREAAVGAGLGLLLFAGLATQTLGLQLIAPSTTGFLTATYVIFTALISAVFLRQRQPAATWVAVLLTVAGITVLALGHDGESTNFAVGASLTLLSAVLYAVHIVLLGRRVTRNTVVQLTVAQAGAGVAVSVALWPLLREPLPTDPVTWAQLLYLGIICGAVALLLQSWGQSHVPATPAAVIMCTEPLWAAVFAVGLGVEPLTVTMLAGGSLVLGALLLAVLPRRSAIPEVASVG
ncbi:DMT family transporter [Tessaracoccus sp. Z1128]